jgi:hypothetical protein
MSTDDRLAQRANALLVTMTPEEKAGQLSQYFYFGGWTTQNELVEAQVRAGRAGSLLFVANPRETNRLQRIAIEESRLGIPLLHVGDRSSRSPHAGPVNGHREVRAERSDGLDGAGGEARHAAQASAPGVRTCPVARESHARSTGLAPQRGAPA